ncbi:MAG: DUF899 family protein [Chloroflexota bacterium]|nr:DUF899 family protein [Chloroflexota bacterium]MDE2919841.1 DUF899 family protein [Chloroflexota bacterium]
MTTVNDVQAELAAAWADLEKAQQRLKEVRRRVPSEPVQDYELRGPDGAINLSELFGAKSDLILIHNMGAGCPYCTMWADGFNGVLHHLEDRSAFVVASPDSVETQQEFRRNRGWRFRMYSAADTSLFKDMGFESDEEHFGSSAMPGVSAFHKNPDGSVVRVASDFLGPGDAYCSVWHLFDLLRDGVGDWEAKFDYST